MHFVIKYYNLIKLNNRLRGTIPREQEWDVMPDLYFFRDQDEIEKDEEVAQKAAQEETEAAPADWSAEVSAP